jgi:hypothetical protein
LGHRRKGGAASFNIRDMEDTSVQDIITGIVLIGIGFAFGGSVFLGNFDLFNIFFDGLGTFFIIKGAVSMYKKKQAS